MDPKTDEIEEPRRGGWRNRRGWVIAGVLIALAWTVPALSQTLTWTTFSPNTPARASEINANFEILRGRLEMAETRLAAAESNITALQMRDDFVPPGTIAFFADTACPAGWGPYDAANGRFVVAVTDMGTPGYLVGDALSDHEDRTHTHTIAHRHPWLRAEDGDKAYHSYTESTPGAPEREVRNWDSRIGGDGSRWPFTYETDGTLYTGDPVQPDSGTARTSDVAPYIQLRACTKS